MPDGGRLEVVLEADRKFATLRILDEGMGIPDEIREKIFDLYFTTKSEGSGIGLAGGLPNLAVAPRQCGSTIEDRSRNGVQITHTSVQCRRGTPATCSQQSVHRSRKGTGGMKARYLSSAVLVLPLLLSGCVHKTNQAQIQPRCLPPIEDAPLPKPDNGACQSAAAGDFASWTRTRASSPDNHDACTPRRRKRSKSRRLRRRSLPTQSQAPSARPPSRLPTILPRCSLEISRPVTRPISKTRRRT